MVRSVRVASAVAAVGFALAGCSMTPPLEKPKVAPPSAWTEPLAPAEVAAAAPSAEWWRRFHQPRLDILMAQAMAGNFDLGAAMARLRQADAQTLIAGAPLLPSLDAGGNVTRANQPILFPGLHIPRYVDTTQSGLLTASYEVDFWGKNAAALAAARATAAASRYDREVVALTVQASVADTYFDFLALSDRLRVARDNLRAAEDILSALRDRERLGTSTSLDVSQQESVVATARAALPPLEQSLRQDANAMAVLTARLPEAFVAPKSSLADVTIPAVAPGLPSALLERRPDVREAEARLVAANANIGEARAAVLPSLQLTGQYGLESMALSSFFGPGGTLMSLAAGVTQPIFRGGALEGGIQLTQAQMDEMVQDYRKAVVSAFADVETALVATHRTDEEERAQAAAVETARRAYQLSRDQLAGGMVDITVVLNTERTLFQTEDALVQARNAHAQAVVGLYRALGGGWKDGT